MNGSMERCARELIAKCDAAIARAEQAESEVVTLRELVERTRKLVDNHFAEYVERIAVGVTDTHEVMVPLVTSNGTEYSLRITKRVPIER